MNAIALSIEDIEKRARRFFAPDTTRSRELYDLFRYLETAGHVFVIGGALRDLAYFGADWRPISDVDLVVSGDPHKLDAIATDLSCTMNRFGGYGLTSGGMKVDFWSLNKTWAKVNNHTFVTEPRHLLNCTFFNWDAILYNVKRRRILAKKDYVTNLHQGLIEINLLANPSPHGSLVRSLRRLVMFDALPGSQLLSFILAGLQRTDWESVVETEKQAFHITYLEQFKSSYDFRRRFLAERKSEVRRSDSRRQLNLPL